MKVLYISGREPGYTRNRVILRGLRENGVEVIECTSSAENYPLRFIELAKKWVRIWRSGEEYDAIFVGYLGQPLVPVVKLLKRRKPIIFDAFISLYDTLVLDRQSSTPGSIVGRLARFLDKLSCRLADRVLLDTKEHINYFCGEFGLKPELFERVFVGADDSILYPMEEEAGDLFTVYFQGGSGGILLPLHGFRYILEAAKLLEDQQDIKFIVLGKAYSEGYRSLIEELDLKNVEFIDFVPYRKLPDYIARSGTCLGIFGSTDKAYRVIPTKAFEAIAMGKPLITARTPAMDELFSDRENVLLCEPADPESLAEAIITLKEDESLRRKIARAGYDKFKAECTPKTIGGKVKRIIEEQIEG